MSAVACSLHNANAYKFFVYQKTVHFYNCWLKNSSFLQLLAASFAIRSMYSDDVCFVYILYSVVFHDVLGDFVCL
jgi:hypothetical protein